MDDDSFSEVTDVGDEDYAAPSSRKKKSTANGTKKNGEYQIRNALRVPRATTYTAQALYDQIHSDDIDLEPEYQRDVVWPEAKQIGIIDSIFRNFYIPPVIFAVHANDDGSERRTCIDGKQRLTSIYRFMDGIIPHRDSFTNEKLWYKETKENSKSRSPRVLPEKYRRLFANKQIVCVEYQDITDGDEREIFQRVQLGMALTPAEKLQVSNSPRASLTREIMSAYMHKLFDDGLLEIEKSRGADFRSIAHALYLMDSYPRKDAGSLPQLEKWLAQVDAVSKDFMEKSHDTFRILRELLSDEKYQKVFRKAEKLSPVEFLMSCLLIAVHKNKATHMQLSTEIGKMRSNVRKEHIDIRLNNKVSQTMMDFINGLKFSKSSTSESASQMGKKRSRESTPPNSIKRRAVAPTPASAKPPPSTRDPPRPRPVPTSRESPDDHGSFQSTSTTIRAPSLPDKPQPPRKARESASTSTRAQSRPAPSAPAALRINPGSLPAPMWARPSQPPLTPLTPLSHQPVTNTFENALMQRMASSQQGPITGNVSPHPMQQPHQGIHIPYQELLSSMSSIRDNNPTRHMSDAYPSSYSHDSGTYGHRDHGYGREDRDRDRDRERDYERGRHRDEAREWERERGRDRDPGYLPRR